MRDDESHAAALPCNDSVSAARSPAEGKDYEETNLKEGNEASDKEGE